MAVAPFSAERMIFVLSHSGRERFASFLVEYLELEDLWSLGSVTFDTIAAVVVLRPNLVHGDGTHQTGNCYCNMYAVYIENRSNNMNILTSPKRPDLGRR